MEDHNSKQNAVWEDRLECAVSIKPFRFTYHSVRRTNDDYLWEDLIRKIICTISKRFRPQIYLWHKVFFRMCECRRRASSHDNIFFWKNLPWNPQQKSEAYSWISAMHLTCMVGIWQQAPVNGANLCPGHLT